MLNVTFFCVFHEPLQTVQFESVFGKFIIVFIIVHYRGRLVFKTSHMNSNLCVCTAFGFSVFGATTCMLDNVRGKDKALTNGIIGGFVGGFCAGTRCKYF